MDTKWKNTNGFSGAKLLAVMIVWLGFLGTMGGLFFWFENRDVAYASSYTESYSFQNDFAALVYDTVEYYVTPESDAMAGSAGEDSKTAADLTQYQHRIGQRLANMVNFVYYVRNTETGESWTNVGQETPDPIGLIQTQPATAFFNARTSDASISMTANIEKRMAGSPYEVYAAVREPIQPGDLFYDKYIDYTKTKARTIAAPTVSIISFVLMTLAFIYLIYITGRRDPAGESAPAHPSGMYTDVHTLLVLIAAFLSLCVAPGVLNVPKIFTIIGLGVVLSLDVFIGLFYVLSMVRQYKEGQLFTNTLLYQLGSGFRDSLRSAVKGKVFKEWLVALLLGYGFINGLIFIIFRDAPFLLFSLFITFNAVVVYYSVRSMAGLAQIMEAVKEISAGNLGYSLDNASIPVSFAAFADDIESIQGGLQKAVAQAVKGERMKTDLITNVSHDLKTPLTSIINYVDLLQKENLENETAAGYVAILEEKAARLKQLIEDLVEASKASSGNLAVTGEKVNLQELMMQACGEYEEKFKQAQLDLHMQIPDEAVVIWADGKHMWRITENLLSNVIKYSLPQSRIYIDIASDNGYGSFTMKNISASPLNISPDQLTERFVRGDESRSTEGSGLGLSIAQSLAGLQRGKFQLHIDGDLFKVTVAIPLWADE